MNRDLFCSMKEQMKPDMTIVEGLKQKIEEEKAKRRTKLSPLKLSLAAVACIAITVLVGIYPGLFVGKDNLPENVVPSYQPEISVVPRWEDMTVEQKFTELLWEGKQFRARGTQLDTAEVGEYLGDSEASGYNAYQTDQKYTIPCSVYSIPSVSKDCVIAVKYDDYDGYYVFGASDYTPDTLGDLIEDLNLRKNLQINQIYYSYWKDGIIANNNYVTDVFILPDPSIIWELLLFDPTIQSEGEAHYGIGIMDISIDVALLGQRNISLAVNDEGYLQTNIFDTAKSFYLGRDKIEEFMNYVLENGILQGKQDESGLSNIDPE